MNTTECSICYEDIIVCCDEIKCNHKFCKSCLEQWLQSNQTCPMCRTIITTLPKTLKEMLHEYYIFEERTIDMSDEEITRILPMDNIFVFDAKYSARKLYKIMGEIMYVTNNLNVTEVYTKFQAGGYERPRYSMNQTYNFVYGM